MGVRTDDAPAPRPRARGGLSGAGVAYGRGPVKRLSLLRAAGLVAIVAGCAAAWSQPAPRSGRAPADAAVTTCRFPLVAIDPDDHCGRPGQRWSGRATGAITSCQPGEALRGDATDCEPRGATSPDDAGVTTRGSTVSAAQRARVPAGMALIAGATWRMGGRWVSVGAFAMDVTEVSVASWRRCVVAGMCPALSDPLGSMARDAMPVVNVTHAQAARYCTFAGGRLPTDAEWTLAVRGVEGRWSPWGTGPVDCARARVSSCGDGARPVGSSASGATPEGVRDLVGNVAEWVHDREGAPRAVAGVDRDPTGPTEGEARWVRGGSFRTADGEAHGFAREAVHEREARVDVGFRCVRGL